jgi:hypothetical protein
MTASDRRRPVTARDFNRLLFALLALAALTILARLITRQESRAAGQPEDQVTLAQWQQTADALFVRGEWRMAADAYYGALERAAALHVAPAPHVAKKLAICLSETGDRRGALYFLRLYRMRLLDAEQRPAANDYWAEDGLSDPETRALELTDTESLLKEWELRGA